MAKKAVKKKPVGGVKAVRRSPAKKSAKKKTPASIEAEIKRVDKELVKLMNRRSVLTTSLLESYDEPAKLFDPHADNNLRENLEKMNGGPLTIDALAGVYRQIISSAKSRLKVQRVAYLGPKYSFTHLAALERFGESADMFWVPSIAAVFEEVNRGNAEYGVVPIENSTDGRIVDTLDMFTRLPLRICGEVQITIHHNLLARCPRHEITEIYSKPQALSQCRDWLSKNMPQARLIDVTSTSTAAQLARDKPGVGAIASRQAAVEYDLQIVAEAVQDNKNNVTRFAVIGDEDSTPSGKDRTAVLLQIPHKPGALSDTLSAFKTNKVNLTWIESFPLRGQEVGYLFFLDFEGHAKGAKVKRTLAEMEKKAVKIVVLGSYPRSEPID